MKNVHIQYKVLAQTSDQKDVDGQAYVQAGEFDEAQEKLAKFLGKKVEFEVTQLSDANAEVIG